MKMEKITIKAKSGVWFKIKFDPKDVKHSKILIRIRKAGETTFHIPDRTFKDRFEVIQYLVEHTESEDIYFKITPTSSKLKFKKYI